MLSRLNTSLSVIERGENMVTMLIALFLLLSLRKIRTMQNISENKELPFLWGIFIGFLLKNDELILPDFYT